MNIALQIKIIREHFFNGSNKDFAEFMGENVNTTSNWINGNNVGVNVLEKIVAKFPSVEPGWILTGDGQMLKSNTTIEGDNYGVGSVHHMNGGKIEVSPGNGSPKDNPEYRALLEENNRLREDNRKLLDQVIKLTDKLFQ